MILLVATAIVLTLFGGRLLELQVLRGPSLAEAALGQRLKTTDLPAQRGSILDSAGDPLAVTVEARNVTADQTLIDDPASTAARLAPIVGIDAAELTPRLTGDRKFVYVAKMITPETWNRISDLELPGIFSEITTRRVYPGGELAANVVGFVGAEGVGMGGLEYALEKELAGKAGNQTFEKGPGGRVIPTANVERVDPEPGMDVRLTIDRDIQFVAQEAIAERVRSAQAASGTVVVMEVKTGRILAMATAPTFDANDPGSAKAADRGNRVLTDVFEPGSTAKVITLSGVVNEAAADPYTVIKVPPRLRRGGEAFQDHTPHGTLRLTLSGIMAQSSNIGTILAAERIGKYKLYDYMKRFGVGDDTGTNFPAEGDGYIPPVENWSATSLPTIAFGQGLSVNAVQAANVFATVANGGIRQDPRLIDAFISPTGEVITPESGERTRVISREASRQVLTMLETVVGDGGTAPLAKIPGYRVGGKTGTAMFVDPRCGCYTRDVVASFIGVAPIDDPELVAAVFVSQPRSGRYGGQLGGPVFTRVMTYSLQARQIPPTGTRAPRIPLTAKG
ncbi:MAG: penicillin-binding protein 2 [Actinobacteria bacterium]|nr:penicillin-binding protein 2 [Actinomycetota bacterium]